ncbi:MAG: hypothetical protein Q8R24_04855 [Legionellaceae bacterium]|nr:hypothetical protein [Legionellaceae bacterium]
MPTIAILDIDLTLIFPSEDGDFYNEELLQGLGHANIHDIYLFTDMLCHGSALRQRHKLITYLQQQGFTIHGVLVPADILGSTTPDIIEIFYQRLQNADIFLQNMAHPPQIKIIQDILAEEYFTAIKTLIDSPNLPTWDNYFDQALKAYLIEEERILSLHADFILNRSAELHQNFNYSEEQCMIWAREEKLEKEPKSPEEQQRLKTTMPLDLLLN